MKHTKGETWVHPFTGYVYKWDGKKWVRTDEQPFGYDPHGFLNTPVD